MNNLKIFEAGLRRVMEAVAERVGEGLLNLTDEEKDREIRAVKQQLSSIKQAVLNILANNNIVITQ